MKMTVIESNLARGTAICQKADSEIVMVDLAFGDDFFKKTSVTGRLLNNHFKHLGHPPEFYRVQDAGFIDGS